MNREDLEAILVERKVSSLAYSLGGGLPSEKYVLNQDAGGRWSVYYSERGQKSGERIFDSEDAACRHLLDWLTSDPSAHSG